MIRHCDLNDLIPSVEKPARAMLAECERRGLDVMVYQTLRTFAEQAELYSKGRGASSEKKVTNAKAGFSWHNYGRALDVVFRVNNGPSWAASHPWYQLGAIGESFGFEWGGRWSLRDYAHFQMRGGMILAQVRKRYYERARDAALDELHAMLAEDLAGVDDIRV